MQLFARRHKGIYYFGAFMVVVGVAALAAAALTNGSPVDSPAVQKLLDSRPIVVVAAVMLIIIGILLRWNVRKMESG